MPAEPPSDPQAPTLVGHRGRVTPLAPQLDALQALLREADTVRLLTDRDAALRALAVELGYLPADADAAGAADGEALARALGAAQVEDLGAALDGCRCRCGGCGQDAFLLDDPLGTLACPGCGAPLPPPAALAASAAADAPQAADLQLFEELGAGGMGRVFRARQAGLQRDIAVKRMRPELARSPRARQRFEREARAAARLHHPGIVAIHGLAEDADGPLFTMEYVPGTSLAALLADDLDVRRGLTLLAEVADAVHYAHLNGITHRDLKPANILVDESGRARVTDFGLAHDTLQEQLTRTAEVMGTPQYMSPEQLRGRSCDARSDVYSLGVIAYEIVSGGRRPLDADHDVGLLEQLERGAPTPLAMHVPDVDRDLRTIVETAMARQPEDRYVSAAALAEDLRLWGSGAPIHARPPGALERAWRAVRDNRAVVASVAAVTGLTITLLVVALVGQSQKARLAEAYRREARKARDQATRADAALVRERRARTALQASLRRLDAARWVAQAEALYAQRGERGEVLKLLRRGEALEAGLPGALRLRGALAIDDREWSQAKALLEASLAAVEDHRTHALLFRWYVDQGRYDEEALDVHLAGIGHLGADTPIGWYGRAFQGWRAAASLPPDGARARRTQALADAERGLALDPDSVYGHMIRGFLLIALERPKQALADLDHVVERTDWAWAHVNRSVVWLALGEPRKAIADCDAAVQRAPRMNAAYRNRALARELLGELDGALADADRACTLAPQSAAARQTRARVLARLRRFREALADCDAGLALDARSAALHDQRGSVLVELGRRREARAAFDRAIAIAPNDGRPWSNRGVLGLMEGTLQSARADLDRAVELGHMDALWIRGELHRRTGDLDRALEDLDAAIRVRPRDASARFNRALVHQARGDLQAAIADYSEAIRADPADPAPRVNRGLLWARLGQPARAVADAEAVLSRDADNVHARLLRAQLREANGNTDGALLDREHAARRAPERVALVFACAQARLRLGDREGAARHLDAILARQPELAGALILRARIAQAEGRMLDALIDLDHALASAPDAVSARVDRGHVWRALGATRPALADYRAALPELDARTAKALRDVIEDLERPRK